MGKDAASLETSRNIRDMLETRWGVIPTSIMSVDWAVSAMDKSKSYQEQKENGKFAGTPFALSGVGARHGSLSRFPQSILMWAVNFYCPVRMDTSRNGNRLASVIDPFAGHNSRAEGVWKCNMNAKVREELNLRNSTAVLPIEASIEFVVGDSRQINYSAEFDFCITSPPFWNIEYYGPEDQQLGRSTKYQDFLSDLGIIAKNCYRALKPNSFIVWEVNDFRKDGVWYPYHADTMKLFQDAGFTLWDIVIVNYGGSFLQAFAQDIENLKIVSKQHSYLVVGKKLPSRISRADTINRLRVESDSYKGSIERLV